ncbi:uncharacterized protein LOC127951687 [Carassius gibelio]|uniref:uncharacterized protein LOC127951687 n=1 Tax=Carassius gibelio TaxID=101364 RepID=UPI002278F8C1|nr:uncharacterized protein LOC127951687 [Carassius gibelio]
MKSDSQNITESANTTSKSCPALDVDSLKQAKKDCTTTYPFYCSSSEGKRVVLQMQLKPVGQVNMKDPVIRANMLAKINDKFDKLGFGNAVQIRWLTRREPQRKNSENDTCTFLDTL